MKRSRSSEQQIASFSRQAVHTLVETRKLNGVDLQAWLAHVLAKLPDHPASSIEAPPYNWKAAQEAAQKRPQHRG